MTKSAHCTVGLAIALTVVGAATALAAPLNGKTYEGSAPTAGISAEGHHRIPLREGGKMSLRVSGNGKWVTVHFSSSSPVLYCRPQQLLQVQTTKAARISQSGSFQASISERFKAGPGAPAIVQVISGHFSGRAVHGLIQTNAPPCSGTASFSATAR